MKLREGQPRRFRVSTYVMATCAADALRLARRTAPDDVQSLESDRDGEPAVSTPLVGFTAEPDEYWRDGEAIAGKGGSLMRYRGKGGKGGKVKK